MSDVSIHIEHLSKSYRITHAQSKQTVVRYKTLQEDLLALPRRLWSAVRNGQTAGSNRETVWALKDVSLDIHEGEVVGIIGRNGAGKSTMLKILSRITDPTEGRAEVYGRVGSLLEVGTGFHPELTGRENIFLNGAVLGMRRHEIAHKFDEIVEFAEVEKFIDTPVKFFSSGMYVRLAFAVAAHLEPEILVVDEVLAVGDTEFQKKCLGKMGDIAQGGRTVLFVSHNMDAIRRLCSRCLLLHGGKVLEDNNPETVINRYLENVIRRVTEYTQPEDKSKKINLRRVTLTDSSGSERSQFEYREGFTLNIEYEVNEPVSNCAVWAAVWTMNGTEVLVTADYDTDAEILGARSPGDYLTTVRFHGQWLNAGNYYIVVGIAGYSPIAFSYDRVEAVYLSICDSSIYPIAEGNTRSGFLKPIFSWNTSKVEP